MLLWISYICHYLFNIYKVDTIIGLILFDIINLNNIVNKDNDNDKEDGNCN